jgi:hypothetical protein
MSTYVVTFAHRTNDTTGLRHMSLAEARSLVAYAARWTLRQGRVLDALTGEEVSS